jgi:hypothetical protein
MMNLGAVRHPTEQPLVARILQQAVREAHEGVVDIVGRHRCRDAVNIGGVH